MGTDALLLTVLLYIVVFFIAMAITRAIFSIGRIVRHLKAQTALLAHIAEKLGVDSHQAQRLYYEAENLIYKKVEKSND